MLKKKWQEMSLARQIGNIGSEVCRMLHFKENGDKENEKVSGERALELIDLTIDDKRWRGRLKEVGRLREVVADFFIDAKNFDVSPESLNSYFLPFAITI